jgi:uncharacterized membrane protein
MRYKSKSRQLSTWGIPALYVGAAIAASITFPRIESLILPDLFSPISISSATAIYSSVASGMIALTGIVFSLSFVMVQFSAPAYSPRLVFLLSRDPLMSHALGIFAATTLYSIAALAFTDRNGSGRVPFVSTWVVIGLLLASFAVFIGLIQRIGRLQINRILVFTGNEGRKVITTVYPSAKSAETVSGLDELRAFLAPDADPLWKPAAIQRSTYEGW